MLQQSNPQSVHCLWTNINCTKNKLKYWVTLALGYNKIAKASNEKNEIQCSKINRNFRSDTNCSYNIAIRRKR
jgi:hypothetical protein